MPGLKFVKYCQRPVFLWLSSQKVYLLKSLTQHQGPTKILYTEHFNDVRVNYTKSNYILI